MGEQRTFNSKVLWVSWRFKNPWRKRRKPSEEEQCMGITVAGHRCRNKGRFGEWARTYCPSHGWIMEEGVCGRHRKHGYHPSPRPEAIKLSDLEGEDVDLTDAADWLASLGGDE